MLGCPKQSQSCWSVSLTSRKEFDKNDLARRREENAVGRVDEKENVSGSVLNGNEGSIVGNRGERCSKVVALRPVMELTMSNLIAAV